MVTAQLFITFFPDLEYIRLVIAMRRLEVLKQSLLIRDMNFGSSIYLGRVLENSLIH